MVFGLMVVDNKLHHFIPPKPAYLVEEERRVFLQLVYVEKTEFCYKLDDVALIAVAQQMLPERKLILLINAQ